MNLEMNMDDVLRDGMEHTTCSLPEEASTWTQSCINNSVNMVGGQSRMEDCSGMNSGNATSCLAGLRKSQVFSFMVLMAASSCAL